MKVLPSGVYQYRFIVDGHWRYAPELPCIQDEAGNAYHVLDLQVNIFYTFLVYASVPDECVNYSVDNLCNS